MIFGGREVVSVVVALDLDDTIPVDPSTLVGTVFTTDPIASVALLADEIRRSAAKRGVVVEVVLVC